MNEITLLTAFVVVLATVSSAQGPVGIVNENGQDPGEGFVPIDPSGGGVIYTEVSPRPKPSPTRTPIPSPATVTRRMRSTGTTSFTYLSGAADTPLGSYSIDSVTFEQSGSSDTLALTDYTVTVSGGEPFATRTFTPSNSDLTLSNRGDVITFFVFARINPCSMELALTGRPKPNGSVGLGQWTFFDGVKAVQKTWCGGDFIYRDTVRAVADLEFF